MSAEAYQRWRAHGGLLDLSRRVKLRLTGADVVRYLNGQVTANVTKLTGDLALPACVTTAKGKLSAEVFLTKLPDAILLDADESLRETLPARLERYIVADDVTVEDVTASCVVLHFLGPPAEGEAFAAGLAPALVRRARRFGSLGWDVILESGALPESLQMLSPELTETIRLEAGIPRWDRELTEDTLPPEAGLDRTHIDYAKGCYIGQEVISRLKSVGHVNRQLRGFVSHHGAPLQSGWSLYAAEHEEKPLGALTSAGYSFALAKPVALGYLRRGSPTGALLARPADRSASPVEVTPAELPLAVHFPSP